MHSYLRSVFLDNANAKSAAMNTISKPFQTGLCVQPLEDAMIEWFLPNMIWEKVRIKSSIGVARCA